MEPEALEFIVSQIVSGGNAALDPKLNREALIDIAKQFKDRRADSYYQRTRFFQSSSTARLMSSLIKLKTVKRAKLSILPTQGNFIGVSHFGLYGEPDHSFNAILAKINAGEIKTLFHLWRQSR